MTMMVQQQYPAAAGFGGASSLGQSHSHVQQGLGWIPPSFDANSQLWQQLQQQQQQQQQQQKQQQKQKHSSGASGRRSSAAKVLPKQLLNGQEVFVCPLCDLAGTPVLAKSKIELTAHLRTHNRAGESAAPGHHRCAICSKELSSQSSLDRHMLTHSDERPFACPICPTAFTTNGNMRRHLQTHRTDPGLLELADHFLNGVGRRRGRRPAAGSSDTPAAASSLSAADASTAVAAASASRAADDDDDPDEDVEADEKAEPEQSEEEAVEPQARTGAVERSIDWLALALQKRSEQMLNQQQQQQPLPQLSLSLIKPSAEEDQPLDLTVGKVVAAESTPQQQQHHQHQPWSPATAAAAAAAAAAATAACLPWPWSLGRLSAFAPPPPPPPTSQPGLWLSALHQRHQQLHQQQPPQLQLLPPCQTTSSAASSGGCSDDGNSERSQNSDDSLGDLSDGLDVDIDVDVDMDEAQRLQAAEAARQKSRKNSYKEAPNLIYCPFETCRQAFPWMSSLKRHIITHTSHKPYACTRCEHAFSTKSNRERHMERIHRVRVKGRQQCLAHLDQDELAAFRQHDRVAEDIGDRLLAELGHAVVTSANPHRVSGGGGGGGGGGGVKLDQDPLAGLSDSCSSR